VHPLSVWEFFHELISHYVAAEGKLWRTLALLTLRPGRLTLEYLAGRRARYIIPLRLYLTASFLFFAFAQWGTTFEKGSISKADLGDDDVVLVAPAANKPGEGTQAAPAETTRASDAQQFAASSLPKQLEEMGFDKCLQAGGDCPLWKRALAPAMRNLLRDPERSMERFSERFQHSMSYAMFCLLPIFAGLLALVYHGRHMYYGEHLVFALHVHSFWFFFALIVAAIPGAGGEWVGWVFIGYGFWALQRVYGGRWWTTAVRGTVVSILYLVIMGLATAALTLALLST
jgi:hypothetical protein